MTKGYELGSVARSEDTRKKKAAKIISVLRDYRQLEYMKVLEIGTGAGYIAHELSKVSKSVDSVDIVDDRKVKTGYTQCIVQDETLPYDDGVFDVVVTNHVLEHVPDQEKHFSEIRRVLKDDGIVYLASPNKWWIYDPHYKLPFISWLPRPISGIYLMFVKRRKWDIYSVSLRRLHHLAKKHGFTVDNKAWMFIERPAKYGLPNNLLSRIAGKAPAVMRPFLSYILPTHLVVMETTSRKR